VALQVNDQGAVALATAPSPVVDADDPRRRGHRYRLGADQAQQGVGADRHGQPRCQARAGLPADAEGDAALSLGKTGGAPHPWGSHRRQLLGEDPARTLRIGAAEAPNPQINLADAALPGQVTETADIPAMHTAREVPAIRTWGRPSAGVNGNCDAVMDDSDPVDDEADRQQG
jgi:hypothetical protein